MTFVNEMQVRAAMALSKLCQRRLTPIIIMTFFVYILMLFVFLEDISSPFAQNGDSVQFVTERVVRQMVQKKQPGGPATSKHFLKNKLKASDIVNIPKSTTVNPLSKSCIGKQTEDKFQFTEVIKGVFVYSVFLDVRSNDFEDRVNGSSSLRLMTVLPTKMNKAYPELYCVGLLESGLYWSVRVTFYEMCENHRLQYGSFILSCRLPKELWQTPPCSVLVSSSTVPSKTSQWFNVHSSVKTPLHKFEVCVPPLFGQIDRMEVIEFIELAHLFGAERIHFYDYDVSPSVSRVLLYYKTRGIVDILPWKLDDRLKNEQIHYNGQSVNIQDCLYRSMFTTRYLAFMDLDEMVVPKKHTDWLSMITSIKNHTHHAGYSVISAFFDPEWRQKDSGYAVRGPRLRSLMDIIRTKHLNSRRTKCMVNPRRIFEIGIHHVSKPIVATLQTVKLPEEIVLLHHYRGRDLSGPFFSKHVVDNSLLAYTSQLETAVERTLQALK